MSDSRFIRFVERQEQKHKPHPGLYVFVAVMWGVIAVTTLVVFLAFRPVNGGRDWWLLFWVIGGIIVVPLSVWRIKRERWRQGSWEKPVKS